MALPLLLSLGLAGSALTYPLGISIYFNVPTPTPTQQALPTPTSIPGPLIMAYYPDWAPPSFPPSKINFGKVDVVDFAFSVPDESFNLTWDDADTAPSLLNSLVSSAHSQGKKVKLSIGGWTGSKYFSSAVRTNASRSVFAKNIVSAYHSYSLDGIDIDWEYPGAEGESGNIVSPADTQNFLEFLGLLRETLPEEALLTATSTDSTFTNALGNPSVDMSSFADVLDWVLLMNYDVNQGRHSPLSEINYSFAE
jgi:chitinase